MRMMDFTQYANLILIPVLIYLVRIDLRLTKIETTCKINSYKETQC